MSLCPCGTGNTLADCCGLFIDGQSQPDNAVSLMRARYTAHTLANMGYILKTHHPASRSDIDENATAKWARESQWMGLEIIDVAGDGSEDTTAKIEFIARYRDPGKQRHTHHEVGVFEKYHGQWFFKDAEVPEIKQFRRNAPKQGRNDPCVCGSGKKFKKCCAITVQQG